MGSFSIKNCFRPSQGATVDANMQPTAARQRQSNQAQQARADQPQAAHGRERQQVANNSGSSIFARASAAFQGAIFSSRTPQAAAGQAQAVPPQMPPPQMNPQEAGFPEPVAAHSRNITGQATAPINVAMWAQADALYDAEPNENFLPPEIARTTADSTRLNIDRGPQPDLNASGGVPLSHVTMIPDGVLEAQSGLRDFLGGFLDSSVGAASVPASEIEARAFAGGASSSHQAEQDVVPPFNLGQLSRISESD